MVELLRDAPGITGNVTVLRESVEVSWYRESDSTVRVMHGGKEVEQCGSWNDFYGFLTSIPSAIKQAEDRAAYYGIGMRSTATVEVTVIVTDKPGLDPKPGTFGRTSFTLIEDPYYVTRDEDGMRQRLEPVTICEAVVWSTEEGFDSKGAVAKLTAAVAVRS